MRTGPTFVSELQAAGLDPIALRTSWNMETGEPYGELTPAQRTTWDTVLAAHNPANKTSEQTRIDGIAADADVQDIVNRLKNNDVAAIKSYLQNNITDLASARQAIIRLYLIVAFLLQKNRDFDPAPPPPTTA
jgi:hypothetical protein